jgi:hypothetical protein
VALVASLLALSAAPAARPTGTWASTAGAPAAALEAADVTFGGFRFTLDPALAANLNVVQHPGDPPDSPAPGGPEPPHTAFILYGEPPVPGPFDAPAAIRVYRTADLAGYPGGAQQLRQLRALLDSRQDLAQFVATTLHRTDNALPFLPVLPAAQVIRARARYVDTGAVHGIAYVTAFRQDVSPFVADDFLAAIQAVSADGAYYVSAFARLHASIFPESPAPFDLAAFMSQMPDYLAETTALLDAAAPADFAPSPAALDALARSFAFPAAPPAGEARGTPAVPAAPTAPAVPTAPPTPTTSAGGARPTPVRFVQAVLDVRLRSGPGTSFSVLGLVFAGQTARVTGVSADGGWWQVVCPDGTTAGCWVSADPLLTRPAAAPGAAGTAPLA